MNYLEIFVHSVGAPLAIACAGVLPLAMVAFWIHRKRRIYEIQAKEPFTQLPLRPPGESLRVQIDQAKDSLDTWLVTLLLAGVIGAGAWVAVPASQRASTGIGMIGLFLVVSIVSAVRIQSIVTKLWDYRLGFTGERIVGEELNQLLASGFRVFHDLRFDDFNIDHVIVGEPGVFIVETKAWRKPATLKSGERPTIEALGDRLEFANRWDLKAVPQARRNAQTLSAWLTSATGERVVASAILTFPGWWVNRRQVHDVNVLNPQEIRHSFPNRPKHPLTPQQMQRIVHQLAERCRMNSLKEFA